MPYIVTYIIPFYLSGFIIVRDGLKQVWHDYYVWPYRDEKYAVHIGLVFLIEKLEEYFKLLKGSVFPALRKIRRALYLIGVDLFMYELVEGVSACIIGIYLLLDNGAPKTENKAEWWLDYWRDFYHGYMEWKDEYTRIRLLL